MTCYNNSKISFIVISVYYAETEPIVGEPLLQPLPRCRDGKGACDVTCKISKSYKTIGTVILLNQMN